MAKLKLSPPWEIYYKEVSAMFNRDPEVNVIYDEENLIIKLFVSSPKKAAALAQLLPAEKEFGNVTLNIEVVPPNGITSQLSNITDAFNNNGAVSRIVKVDPSMGFGAIYVIFNKDIIQYFDDNLRSYTGYKTTIYEDIARNIFEAPIEVFFCTETVGNGFKF